MKKLLGVIVAITICICFAVPCFAATEDTTASSGSSLGDLASMLENGGASLEQLNELLQNEDLMAAFEDSDIAALFSDASNGDQDALNEIEGIIAEVEGSVTMPEKVSQAVDTANSVINSANTTAAQEVSEADTTAASASVLDGIFAPLSAVMDVAPFEEMLSGASNNDVTSILTLVANAMGSEGIDLASFTSSDVGQFDIANLLAPAGGTGSSSIANLAESATDVTAGLADTLIGGLEALGLDTKTIEGLLDNEIVNFFANMYIGFIGKTEEAPADETTTTSPPVVTTTTPKTGDTSSVFVAIATLFVAGTAAGVCLKKKENA